MFPGIGALPEPATESRSRWWKRGDVAASATHANTLCWVHQDSILDDEEVSQSLQEAWENEGSNDEPKIELHGLFRHLGKCVCFPTLPTAFQLGTSLDGSSVSTVLPAYNFPSLTILFFLCLSPQVSRFHHSCP